MDVGIVGLAGSGRTTVFRALLAHRAPREAGTRHASGAIGSIHVQDPRLGWLSAHFHPRRTTPIEIRVHDLCRTLETAFQREEIEAMKRMDVLLCVIPGFLDPSGEALRGAFERLLAELCLEDLAAVERRLARAPRDRLEPIEQEALEQARGALERETPLAAVRLTDPQRQALRGYALVTDRPLVGLLNLSEERAGATPPEQLQAQADARGVPLVALCGALEAEMAELAPEDREDFLAEYGVGEPSGAAVTRAVLEAGDLIPFFTVGEDECRAWPVARGTTAREAAGRIHSDIERGFIRAEVIPYPELEALGGSLAEARRAGKLRLEGKDYGVQDGDVIHFRFHV